MGAHAVSANTEDTAPATATSGTLAEAARVSATRPRLVNIVEDWTAEPDSVYSTLVQYRQSTAVGHTRRALLPGLLRSPWRRFFYLMISLGFLFGSLPGFILLCCLLGIGGL